MSELYINIYLLHIYIYIYICVCVFVCVSVSRTHVCICVCIYGQVAAAAMVLTTVGNAGSVGAKPSQARG